ncbi:MAG TPA: sugar ABC transporter substrate-binding protein [Gemmatimonadaceae bacterium]|nr:sugar ABC transporter substrate-binding protein [Gemmatimonadaceae bacterium]
MNSRDAVRNFLLATLIAACAGSSEPVPPPDPSPLTLSLDHLRRLGLDAVVNGRPVRVVALYAEAPDYRPTPSPERDGSEGIASLDDAARAAIVYLRAFEMTGDPTARDEALGLLAFVTVMEQGDGEFINFIDARGRPNRIAPSSRKSMSYWAARGIWALGEAVRVLGTEGLKDVPGAREVLDRAIARMAREVDGGRLIGGSATATSEALLGILALHEAEPSARLASLASRTAALLVPLSRDGQDAPPWGARTDSPDAIWHAWGARSTAALARTSIALNRPDLLEAARREADGLWGRFLLAGQVPAAVSPNGSVRWFPQIAYGVGPVVEGYLEIAEATGHHRYAVYAGVTAAWFFGANPARVAMYDRQTGRTFDGIDGPSPVQVNRNAGAESTIEALLALQRVAGSPEAMEYLTYRTVDVPAATLTTVPDRRTFEGAAQKRLTLRREAEGIDVVESPSAAAPITLTYWPAANPSETWLATRLASQWNADNPDVQVRVQPLPAGRSSEEVLLAAIVAKATPDISSNVSSALLARLVRAGSVVRLDDRSATAARLRERTNAEMLASLRLPDGGIYAFPWKTNPEMLMYNVDLLASAGVDPPRTHSELLDAFRRLARDTDGDGRLDRWPIWAGLKTTWFERFYDFYPLYLASAGGRTLVADGKVTFDNAAAISALEVLRQGFETGSLPRVNFSIGRDPFVDGRVAMKIIGPWFVRELNELKVPGLRYDVAPVPAADGTPLEDRYAFADLRSIAIFSTTRHPDAAARFVAYLTSPAADQLLIEHASQLPYRRNLAHDPRFAAALARWPTLATYATYVGRTRDLDLDPDVVEIFDLLSEAYEEAAVYGTRPVREALTRAATEAQRILDAR